MGLHGSPTSAVAYDEPVVPYENLLGQEGDGLHQALATLDAGRISVGAISVGRRRRPWSTQLPMPKTDTHLAEHFELRGHPMDGGGCRDEIAGARLLVYQAAWLKAGPSLHESGRDGQAVRHRDGRTGLPQRHPDPRWIRLQQRVSGGADFTAMRAS